MTTVDLYIDRVLAGLPRATPMRQQIALELRGHITERLEAGQSVDAVLAGLGDPDRLALSYLAAVPLASAPFLPRILAKLADCVLVAALLAVPVVLAWLTTDETMRFVALIATVVLAGFVFIGYVVIAEYTFGQTLGKRLAGLLVVREDGAPISFGQSIVRQLPVLLQVFWIDVLFALFTDRRQRAFEMLSKTRVVRTV